MLKSPKTHFTWEWVFKDSKELTVQDMFVQTEDEKAK